MNAIKDELKAAQGEPVPRKLLLKAAVEGANITERYAVKALEQLTQEQATGSKF